MIDRKELKARAKEFAFNNKWLIWKPVLIVAAIMAVASSVGVLFGDGTLGKIVTLALSIATIPLLYGEIRYIMDRIHGKEVDLIECLKAKYKIFVPLLILSIVAGVLISLASALLIVPGIILALAYSMTEYIAAEADEELDGIETLKKSRTMMNGHKWEYFVLQLSFIGWILLGEITLGIAFIWVLPYMTVTQVYYYDELKKLEK